MGIWFLSHLARLAEERAAIDTLQQEADWLAGAEWTLSSSELAIDAAIVAHGHTYNVRMTYPRHFPNTPPIVRPADSSDSWSSHQYQDGTLCLEWRPDTWVPTVTGAQVLESVYRLLDIENPLGSDTPQVAPSAHYLTQGQELRGALERAYLTESLQDYLRLLPNLTPGAMSYSIHRQRDSYTLLIQELNPVSGTAWQDTEIPNALRKKPGVWFGHGFFFTTDLPPSALTGRSSLGDLEAALASAGYSDVSLSDSEALAAFGLEKPPEAILVTDHDQNPHIYSVYGGDRLFRVHNLPAGDDAAQPRTPVELQPLAEKRIGIVGLGSLGSKVGLALARMGAKRFYLVDDDILMAENICRHALDWQSVGEHKTAAVAQAIDRIVPGAEIGRQRRFHQGLIGKGL
jgi:ubiquitin-protein ligase